MPPEDASDDIASLVLTNENIRPDLLTFNFDLRGFCLFRFRHLN